MTAKGSVIMNLFYFMTEEQILRQAETVCSLTDLFFGFVVTALIVILIRFKAKDEALKKWWTRLFIALDVSCFLGFLGHFCFIDGIVNIVIWFVLYPLLMEDVILLDLTALCSIGKGQRPTSRDTLIMHLIGGVLVAFALLLSFVFGLADKIVLLTAFATVLSFFGFGIFIRNAFRPNRVGERLIFAGFIPIITGAIIEINANTLFKLIWYIDHHSVMHLLTTLGIVIMFTGALRMIGKKE